MKRQNRLLVHLDQIDQRIEELQASLQGTNRVIREVRTDISYWIGDAKVRDRDAPGFIVREKKMSEVIFKTSIRVEDEKENGGSYTHRV